ncbi:hypothetical protein [Nevskia soli]|uniref:hypothetical protein n=1 Tax=Nevskia soli TaxID=418856 RepID=UPI0015D6F8D0|nr:hypothetical protein [Nevskia soli]
MTEANRESILKTLYREFGASLLQSIALERCSRRTEFDEEQFVNCYPYLPHLVDLAKDIAAGIGGSDSRVVNRCLQIFESHRMQLAAQPIGALVSLDKMYEAVESALPREKRNDILAIGRRFEGDKDYPGMAPRVVKALCLMEFVGTDLPRTTPNIAALLVQRVPEPPPVLAVAAILGHMNDAQFVRWTDDGWELYDFNELRRMANTLEGLSSAVGIVNPRLPGWHNDLLQGFKKLLARGLGWYTRPLLEFVTAVSQLLKRIEWALSHLSANMTPPDVIGKNTVAIEHLAMSVTALEARLEQSEKKRAAAAVSVQEQLDLLHEQMMEIDWSLARQDVRHRIDTNHVKERTAYIIGLFGTGRRYINEVVVQNIGERSKYFRDTVRLHPGPTPMIYSGHATMKYVSRAQELPPVMNRILGAVESRFADLIFAYRHPLDSVLTNWVWWRTYIRDHRSISGIAQRYENTDELCLDLDRNFLEFKSFAEGDPGFFEGEPGLRFLSFREFVEETELHFNSATLTLRLEDFMINASREFSKIAEVMSVDVDLSRSYVIPPKSKPFGYRAVRDGVPQFRDFIDGLDAETKRRIEKIGYDLRP